MAELVDGMEPADDGFRAVWLVYGFPVFKLECVVSEDGVVNSIFGESDETLIWDKRIVASARQYFSWSRVYLAKFLFIEVHSDLFQIFAHKIILFGQI